MASDLSEVSLLEALRIDRGLSMRDVEKLTGVDHKTISKYEKGVLSPTAAKLVALGELFNVRPAVLLDDTRRAYRRRLAREEIFDAA